MKPIRLFITLLPVALAVVVSCGPKDGPVEDPKPTVLTVNPTSKSSESGFAHDLVFKIVCDGEFEAKLAEGTWATITERKEGNGENATNVIVHLEDNIGEQTRTETLTVTAGDLKQTATITQLALGVLLPVDKLELVNLQAQKQTWNMPAIWAAKCFNTDGTEASWFTVSPSTGLNNTDIDVSICAKELNLGDDDRTGYVEVNLGALTVKMDIVHKPMEYGKDTFGIFNIDGKDASLTYTPLKNQYSRKTGSSGVFRILDLENYRFLVIKGLPSALEVGNSLQLDVFQSMTEIMPYNSQYTVRVFKENSDKVWMIDDNNICFVVPK